MKFTIPGELPTLNEIIKASKSHPMAYANLKKDYTALVTLQARGLPQVKRADFDIEWHCKNKRKDPDNITVGKKFIFDGLVKAGVLPNDGWAQVGIITDRLCIDKDNPRIEVTINEVTCINCTNDT